MLGKYRILVLGIAVFFTLTVSVYSLNFFALRQVADDARKINDGGKLGGYSQQLAKAILTLSHEAAAGEPVQTSLAELSEALASVEFSLAQLRTGVGEEIDPDERDLLARLERQWSPLRDATQVLLDQSPPDAANIEAAVIIAKTRNVRLLQLAADYTRQQELRAAERAGSLRDLQSGAILLSLLNFLFIVVHVARRLRRSDREAEEARRETDDILGTVREGLFLIDREGLVGGQFSAHLGKVFPHPLHAGDNFLVTLAPLVSPEALASARQYVSLLFNRRVKPALLESLNPLQRIAVTRPGNSRPAYLNFGFQPVRASPDAEIHALLVTAIDVSQEVRLEQELAGAEERARNEVALLLGVLESDPAEVLRFLEDAKLKLEGLNAALRDVTPDPAAYHNLLTQVLRVLHSIKGEAAALSIGTVASRVHELETRLSAARSRRLPAGDDLIPVATGIGQLLQELAKVDAVVGRISAYARAGSTAASTTGRAPEESVYGLLQRVQRLALSAAADLNKKLRIETSLPPVDDLPEAVRRVLREGLPQLIRNAVAHGIESVEERLRAGKDAEACLRIELRRCPKRGIELSVSDDGRGIDLPALRDRLIAGGRHDPERVSTMNEHALVATLFEPGVTTAAEVTEHAGRGVGLDVVSNLARETGARLKLASRPLAYTRFTLQWSAT